MAPRNQFLSRAKPIFDGADSGVYALPPEITARRSAVALLREMKGAANAASMAADPGAVRSRLAATLPDLAAKGRVPAGWAEDLTRAQEAQVRAGAEYAVLDEAVQNAESLLVREIDALADVIVVESLRPVLDGIITKARRAVEAAKGDPTGLSPRLIARADKPVRDAFVLIEELAETYSTIRSAQAALRLVTGDVDNDAWSACHEIANLADLWPMKNWQNNANQPPWPKGQTARLVWLCRPEVEVWMPTAVECNDRYQRLRSGSTLRPRVDGVPVYIG